MENKDIIIKSRYCILCGLRRKLKNGLYCKECQEINNVIHKVGKEKNEYNRD